MRSVKKMCSLVLVAAVSVSSGILPQSDKIEAAAKVVLSTKKLIITKGKSKVLKLKNAKKKVSWKQSTKKYVSIRKTGKNSIRITGKKSGITKITAKYGKKKYTCKVTVKKAVSTSTPMAKPTTASTKKPIVCEPNSKVTIKVNKKAINAANMFGETLSNHRSMQVTQSCAKGLSCVEMCYFDERTCYFRSEKEERYVHGNRVLSYLGGDDSEERYYAVGLPFLMGDKTVSQIIQESEPVQWGIEEDETILSCYSKEGKIYLTSKLDKDSVAEAYGQLAEGKKGVYALFESILDEDSLELIQNKEYLCDQDGNKEWMKTSTHTYDVEQPDRVTKMSEIYDDHMTNENLERRKLNLSIGTGFTDEIKKTISIPKGDDFLIIYGDKWREKYDTVAYVDKSFTQRYVWEKADRQEDVSLYFNRLDTSGEESDTISYADGVSAKMSNPDFWADLSETPDKLLATDECVVQRNQEMLEKQGTNLTDLKNYPETYNGIAIRDSLAKSVTTDANRTNYYANGVKVDKTAYFDGIRENIVGNEAVTESDTVTYAICTTRTELKWCPTSDYIGYSAKDTDNEAVLSAIGINEPMIIKARTADGKFYWGYSENCYGWVAAEDVAICSSKEEWMDAWDVQVGKEDFLVVTTDRVVTETSFYNPAISARTLTLGTRLKLVAKENIPDNLDGRGVWSNYVVYMPTRDADGKYVKEMALISEHSNVSVGYLPVTERNILHLAFECLGNRYGWGGSVDAMDCSMYASCVYRCFGFVLPRNTTWQVLIPSFKSIASKTDDDKTEDIRQSHVGSILYFPGHEMLYLGRYKGRSYVISALGSLVDVGDESVRSVYSVTINTLDAKRKDGKTWLTHLSGINSFEF